MAKLDNYSCNGQMSIFDFMEQDTLPASEGDMIRRIEIATGLKFAFSERLERWIAKKSRLVFKVCYMNFAPGINNGRRGISLDVVYPSMGGCGCIWDDIDAVVDSINRHIKLREEGKI